MKLDIYDMIDEVTSYIDCNYGVFETDEQGQVILFTGIYRWADGSYHDVKEPD